MCSVEALREFVTGRLTAAAVEIFSTFEQSVFQFQEEVDAQRRLLGVSRKQRSKSSADKPQQHFCREEQLWNKQENSCFDQGEPEPTQIKEEQERPQLPHIEECQEQLKPLWVKEDLVQLAVEQQADTITDTVIEHRENLDAVREFINGRLTAAAREFLMVFQQTIFQYQEEITAQRRLLDITLNPQLKLHRIDSPVQHVFKEEQVCSQDINSCLDLEEPEAPRMNGTQREPEFPHARKGGEELCSSREVDQIVMKQEVDFLMMNPTAAPSESEADVGSLLSRDSVVTESRDQNNIQDSKSSKKKEIKPNRRHHSMNFDSSSFTPQSSLSVDMRKYTVDKPHYCETCGKSFTNYSSLLRHLRTHTSEKAYSCVICCKGFSRQSNLLVHMRTHSGERPHSCVKCGKSFTRRGNLLEHMRTHTGEKPYFCVACHKTFSKKNNLLVHMRTHTGEKPYSCEICYKRFSHQFSLSVHMRNHTGQKPHPCLTCDERFSQQSHFLGHVRTHAGETPDCCLTCGKHFTQQSTLLGHISTQKDEKPYSCETCGKNFAHESSLFRHLRTHTGEKPYSCLTCGKSFTRQGNLLEHMRTHTGEKPYLCVICDKTFSKKNNMLVHMRTHTGEKPYSCEICFKSFSHQFSLSLHMRKHNMSGVILQ